MITSTQAPPRNVVEAELQNRLAPDRLPERLRELREALGLKQEDVAARAGLKRAYLAGLESGRKKGLPPRETLWALAEALETDTRDLLVAAGYLEDLAIYTGIDRQFWPALRGSRLSAQRAAIDVLNASKRPNDDE